MPKQPEGLVREGGTDWDGQDGAVGPAGGSSVPDPSSGDPVR